MPDYSNLPSNNPNAPKPATATDNSQYPKQEKMFEVKPKKEKSKLSQIFIQGTPDKAKDFISKSVWPSLRDWLWTNSVRTLETLIIGEARYQGGFPKDNRQYDRVGGYDYSNQYRRQNDNKNKGSSLLRFDFSDIRFYTEDEAARCLRKLDDLCAEQGDVAVAQLLDLVGRYPEPTDWNWVWDVTDIRRAYPRTASGGDWILMLPEPRAKRN